MLLGRRGILALNLVTPHDVDEGTGRSRELQPGTETAAHVAFYAELGFTVRGEWDVPLQGRLTLFATTKPLPGQA